MFGKPNKEKKKVRETEPDMIEMEDLSTKPLQPNQVNINQSQLQGSANVDYPTLSEVGESSQIRLQGKAPGAQQPHQAPRLPQYPGMQSGGQQYPGQPQPARDSAIRMNGMTFGNQNAGQAPQKKRSRVPQMQNLQRLRTVCCRWCTLNQLVAGNSHIFICTVCNNMNECKPTYNLFICCGCHTQVCYQLGVSQMVRCTRCKTVNRVPLNVSPNYSREFAQMQQQQQQAHQHQQQPLPQYSGEQYPPARKELLLPPSKKEQESEIIIEQEPQVSANDRFHPQKRQFQQPDLLQFEQESWQQPPQKQNLLPAKEPQYP